MRSRFQLNRDSAEAHTRVRGLANADATGGGAVQHPNGGGWGDQYKKITEPDDDDDGQGGGNNWLYVATGDNEVDIEQSTKKAREERANESTVGYIYITISFAANKT